MITKKVVRVRSPEEREEAPAEAPHRIDDEPPMVDGRYLDRATGEPIFEAVPRETLARVAGEVRLDKRQVALFLLGFATVAALVLAAGYFVGRGESVQEAREAAAPPPPTVPARPSPAPGAAPSAKPEASAAAPAPSPAAGGPAAPEAAPKRDPISFYTELAERKPESAVALLKERDPGKFLEKSASRPAVAGPKEDPGDRGLFTVQVSSFGNEEGANRLLDLLRRAETPAYILPSKVGDKTWYRVRVGQYTSRAEAERAAKKVRDEQGFPAYVTPSQS